MNSYFIGISPNATIALINGSVGSDVAESYTINENAGVSVRKLYDSATELPEDTGEVSDYYFTTNNIKDKLASVLNAEGEVTIDSCTFDVAGSVDFRVSNAKTVIIENCTFLGATGWALDIGGEECVYIVRNNSFQGARGINVHGLCSSGNLIENNEFRLLPSSSGKARALQLSDYTNRAAYTNAITDAEVPAENKYDDYVAGAPWIIFKDNNIVSADAVVNVHESMVFADRGSYYKNDGSGTWAARTSTNQDTLTNISALKENDLVTNEYYKSIISFQGTNSSSGVAVKVGADVPDNPYEDYSWTNGENGDYMNTMVNYYNSIFQ